MTETPDQKPPKTLSEQGLAVGLGAGVLIGVLTHNIGLWICLGLAIGVGWDQWQKAKADKDRAD